jgi:adenine-specific DNA methylase
VSQKTLRNNSNSSRSQHIDLREFPSTRYQGSKRKILPWINDVTSELKFETVLDAFGGTASVSYLFKKAGKSVTYNDVLRFNHWIGKAIIENQSILLTEDDFLSLLPYGKKSVREQFIATNFKGDYFLDEENIWLDGVIARLQSMNHYPAGTLEYKKALAYYALFQACLVKRPFNLFHRKNLDIRTRNVERTFGNKATWDTPFENHFARFAMEVNSLVFDSGKQCKAINQSVLDLDEQDFDLVYLDPPYFRRDGANETSDYAKCYHFLEGMTRYSNWASILRNKKGYASGELNKDNIREVLEELFSKFHRSVIIVSYKFGGVPSIDLLRSLLKKFKRKVCVRSRHYKYALNHQNGDAQKNREVLIIGQ